METLETFAHLILHHRNQLGMTRVTAAKRLNLSYHKLFMWEHGVLRPPKEIKELRPFCEVYGIPLTRLQLSVDHQNVMKQIDKKKLEEERHGKIVRL